MKRCNMCKQEFPATTEYFPQDAMYAGGLRPQCRPCHKAMRIKQAEARQQRIQDIPLSKACSLCGIEYPATSEYFYSRKGAKDGLRNECKKCLEQRNRKWREANPNRVRETGRAKTERHRARNREAFRQRTREWKSKNPDKIKAYRDANRSNFAVYSRRRKDRVSGLSDTLTTEQWQFALEYFGHRCAVCERPLDGLFHTPAIDHWIPVSNPECPGTVATNTVPLCHGVGGCNNSKHDKDPAVWLVAMYGSKNAHKILSRIQNYFDQVRSFT